MCGIVGIVGLNSREPVDETRLKIMRDVLRHLTPIRQWREARFMTVRGFVDAIHRSVTALEQGRRVVAERFAGARRPAGHDLRADLQRAPKAG